MPNVFGSSILEGFDTELVSIRAMDSTANGRWRAIGQLVGRVSVELDGHELYETDIRPDMYKGNADRFLHDLRFSTTGDLLHVCTGVDVVTLNSTTGTVAWEFSPKRVWGFGRVIPLGIAVTEDDTVVISCSNGQFVLLDRKGRVVMSRYENDAPQSIAYVPGQHRFVGTDGYRLRTWDTENLERRENLGEGRFYAVAGAADAPVVAVRCPGRFRIYDLALGGWTHSISCAPGGPKAALSPGADRIAFIEGGRPVVHDLVSGNRATEVSFENEAVTVAWMSETDQFAFGFRDGSVELI